MPPEVRTFLEGILQDANMTSSDEQMHEEMLKELFARFDNYMTSSIVENLKEEDMEEFIKMGNDKRPKEEIEKFITEKIPNAQDVFAQAMMDFRNSYLGNVEVARNSPQDEVSGTTQATEPTVEPENPPNQTN